MTSRSIDTVLMLHIIHISCYWLVCLICHTIDLYMEEINSYIGRHSLYKIKAESRSRHKPSDKKLNSAIWVSLFNQSLAYPVVVICSKGILNDEMSWDIFTVILQLFFYLIVADQWFYWTHRIMHIPFIYSHVHSFHHRWVYPVAVRTLYAHPVEHIVTNLGSIMIGPLLWSTSSPILAVWLVLATINSVMSHSGIHLPFMKNEEHDIHHRRLNYNYGVTYFSDYIWGTYAE